MHFLLSKIVVLLHASPLLIQQHSFQALHVGKRCYLPLDLYSSLSCIHIIMVDETAALFPTEDDVDLLADGAGSPFTDDHPLDHEANLESLFYEHPLPSLNSPLTASPPRSANSSVGSGETVPRDNSTVGLGLPGNELVEEDWRDDAFDLRARKDILLQM